jgi:hypothetical protein
MAHRVHVVPSLRAIGERLLLSNWLAITIGHDIFTWRELSTPELAHELEHVRQWERFGVTYVPRYFRASWTAWRAGRKWYEDNAFEVAARAAATRAAGEVPQ